jgi:hypothetical protein
MTSTTGYLVIKKFPWEAAIWFTALILLACYFPSQEHAHFTICPLALAGVDWCPGCGLGRSLSHLLHGQWQLSFTAHPLGGFALIILSLRIINLTKTFLHNYGKNN